MKGPNEDKESKSEIKKLQQDLTKSNEKIIVLEKQYDECEAALIKITEESERLKSELKDLREIMKLNNTFEGAPREASTCSVKTVKPTTPTLTETIVENDDAIVEEEFNCLECPYQGTEQSQPDKHIKIKHRMICRNCDKAFKTKPDLMVHRKTEHYDAVAMCRNGTECKFSDKCWWKHRQDHENMIECYFCKEVFASKGEVMLHRKKEHNEFVKSCNKFLIKTCNLNEETCWFKHDTNQEEFKKSNISDENKSVFWNLQNNLKRP